MKTLFLLVGTMLLASAITLYILHLHLAPQGRYQIDRTYESVPISFATGCEMADFSPEKRVIFDRRRLSTSKACVDRAGSIRDVKPVGVVMTRSRYDGAYKVTVMFDDDTSHRLSKLLARGQGEVVVYRGNTLLARVITRGSGLLRKVTTYHDEREEADAAMDQVAAVANQDALYSWRR